MFHKASIIILETHMISSAPHDLVMNDFCSKIKMCELCIGKISEGGKITHIVLMFLTQTQFDRFWKGAKKFYSKWKDTYVSF